MNIGALLAKAARTYPERPALTFGGQGLSYAAFRARAASLASGLRTLGVRPADRVAILQHNGPALLETLFAVFTLGAAAVPINARLHPMETAVILQDSQPTVIVLGGEFIAGLESIRATIPPVRLVSTEPASGALAYDDVLATGAPDVADAEVRPDDLAWLFYTSGTTGRPKGAMLTHRTLLAMTMNVFADIFPITHADVVLHAAPLTHGSGLYALSAIAKGAHNVLFSPRSFDPAAIFREVAAHRVTLIPFLSPTQVIRLARSPAREQYDVSSLRGIVYGGAPMAARDVEDAVAAFGPILIQLYGQGEAPMTITALGPDVLGDRSRRGLWTSAGIPRTDVEVRVVDEADASLPSGVVGEVVVRGDVVMAGYWRNPEATTEVLRNGWLHTGDLGYLDEHGYLFLQDRKRDVIITGGANVYCREVEDALLRHPTIHDAVVFGIPDDEWGEAVMAVVVPMPGAHLSEAEVIAFCRDHLAAYKKPKHVQFADEIPRNAYGKVTRRELREPYWRGRSRKI
jgi:acyl-CoA synthetase (AMP-forming)/AMP-acid ligase II